MKKKVQKLFAMLLAFSMTMSLLCASASATGEGAPYWQITREVDGVTQTITHAVLDSNGNLVNIGAGPGELDADNLAAGTMAAQKFGAFANEADAANGIVKLTFDVVGKPIEVPGPLDVVIIADESGSLNMYGRAEGHSGSYMPCLNKEHAYLVGDLQEELYQIALARLTAAAGEINNDLKVAVSDALKLAAEDQAAALAAILAVETAAVTDAEAALLSAETALAAAEEAHAHFATAIEDAAAIVEAAKNALEEAKGALAEEKVAVEAAQADVDAAQNVADGAQAAVTEAQRVADAAQTDLDAAKAAEEPNQDDIDAAQAELDEAKTELEDAQVELNAAKAELETAKANLTTAQSVYDEAYAANEMITAAETTLNEKKAALNEAETAAQETATAVAAAKTAVDAAAATVETAKAALEAKKAAVDVLVSVNAIEKKLENDASAYDVYIKPHTGNMDYTVFKHWDKTALRSIIQNAELVNGKNAEIVIPDILTDDDLWQALYYDWDTVTLNKNGQLTYSSNVKWEPDTAHCYPQKADNVEAYVLIPQPENTDLITEDGKYYSYWSPAANNPYGCYDRMMIEKEGVVSLTNQILKADPNNNRVAYVGFTKGAYPSLSSFGLGDNGFCGLNDADLNEMLAIMGNTNGHDYTNYVHPLYMARKIISMREDQSRPCYVVFISDGVPTTTGGYTKQPLVKDGGWNVLSLSNGDYPWYDDVYDNSDTDVEAAGKMANYFKGFLGEVLGEDTGFYTVGFSTDATASALLASMASDENSFFNCANVEEFLADMTVVRQEIMTHYPSGVLTDVIGEDFDLIIDTDHPFTVDGDKYYSQPNAAEDERVTFVAKDGETSIDSISWNLEQVDTNGVQISFYVQLEDMEGKHGELADGEFRIYDTNADTKDVATGETVATGANLEYHELKVDSTKSEGYYAEEDATNLPLKTPQLKIWNGEVTPENPPEGGGGDEQGNGGGGSSSNPPPGIVIPENPVPLAPMPEPEVPLAPAPELEEIPEEEVPLAAVPMTGDAAALWLALSALSGTGLAGVTFLGRKKRED